MKRSYPITSHIAKAMKTDESKQRDYDKIVSTLKVLGMGTYEDIANQMCEKDLNVVSRRLKEMLPATNENPKGKGLVYNTGIKKLTSRNRPAFMYSIKSDGSKSAAVEHTFKPSEKSTSDYANKIIESAKGNGFIQPELF